MSESQTLPVFPLRKSVLFPHVLAPYSAGRPASLAALEQALSTTDKTIVVFAQRDPEVREPGRDQLYSIGTRAYIRQMARGEETVEVILQGLERVELQEVEQTSPYLRCKVRPLPMPDERSTELEALQQEVVAMAARYFGAVETAAPFDVEQLVEEVEEPMHLVYLLGAMTGMDQKVAQGLLEAPTRERASRILYNHLQHEVEVRELRREIAGQAESRMGRQQREYLLRQQLRAIQEELGEAGDEQSEVLALRDRMREMELPEPVREEADRELKRLESIPAASPEHQVARTYVELILELPWGRYTEDVLDLKRARTILDDDHFGLERVKERILEHLAVMKLNPGANAPILCFVGPPGVGKTSLGKSIARALGRRFDRLSLGGMHDEAELRGHRRTYIGAMPGRILQAIRRAGAANPLLMLDEVDKLGRDFRGDPSSALLEILDPAQNYEFRDNYLDLPFDLSKVFFITTANSLDTIPRPLLDRMETIRLSGYSDEEKLQIARRYLVERRRRDAGLSEQQFVIPEPTLKALIAGYTREAGVRELERVLGRLARRVALRVAADEPAPERIEPELLNELLGPERFLPERMRRDLAPGMVTGLAWTETGGDVLYVEAIRLPDGQGLTLTGQLGSVMQESAKAAQSYVLSSGERLGIDVSRDGVHIHVPAGAIPKDGPSAGVTIATALISLYTGLAPRADTAMTGEISLAGLVMPVGGIKEKVLAARRAGLKRVILPQQNEKDLQELPAEVRQDMELILVDRIEEAAAAAIPELSERLESFRAGVPA